MKFSEAWLREWVNPAIDRNALIAQLNMAGLEVEEVWPVAADFSGIVVAKVLSVEKHPDADKLKICSVNDGQEILQIVCGAANVTPGIVVALAKIGATLGATKISKGKLRGVESFGMLCSAQELGIAEQSNGLWILPQDAPLGVDVRDYFKLNDATIHVDLTPNRGDCLSIAGIAREVAVLNHCENKQIETPKVIIQSQLKKGLKIEAQEACPHYVGRVIENVNIAASSPLWLQEKLRRSGLRSIDPIVDVTNYTLLALGQPLHAFDLAKLEGDIEVKLAKNKSSLVLLNDQEITLEPDDLVIADKHKILALAGIMGGKDSAVSATTQSIFLESAFFSPAFMSGKARRQGLSTDSSHRFERGVDPDLQKKAIEFASYWIIQIAGGQAGELIEYQNSEYLPAKIKVELRYARIKQILGIERPKNEIENILTGLGMKLNSSDSGWTVEVPSYRFDIFQEIDLIEEIARIIGYDHIPAHLPSFDAKRHFTPESQLSLSRLKQVLVDRDYDEAITYSFTDAKSQTLFNPALKPLALKNPISPELGFMRSSLLPGLIQAMQYNLNRQQERVRLFETGLCFKPEQNALVQEPYLAAVITGSNIIAQWGQKARPVDFFDIKKDLEVLLGLTRKNLHFKAEQHPALHPGQSAAIFLQDQQIGWIGQLHPEVAEKLDIKNPVFCFELVLSQLLNTNLPRFATLSKYPSIRRDIAVMVAKTVRVEELKKLISQKVGDLLVNLSVFDVYEGEGIPSGHKSVALGLVLQHPERTLVEEDVQKLMNPLIEALQSEFAATLRE